MKKQQTHKELESEKKLLKKQELRLPEISRFGFSVFVFLCTSAYVVHNNG
jgi:hypothetical protein